MPEVPQGERWRTPTAVIVKSLRLAGY